MAISTPITTFHGDYRFLSNFHPAPVTLNGECYPTVEHAYQAAKTLDLHMRKRIQNAPRPGLAKRLGQLSDSRWSWFSLRVPVMSMLVTQKFMRHTELREKLIATGNRTLIEGNTWNDTFWGQCPVGLGENTLGIILMEVRSIWINHKE